MVRNVEQPTALLKSLASQIRGLPWARIAAVLGVGSVAMLTGFAFKVDRDIQMRLANGWFLPPIEFFTANQQLAPGGRLNLQTTLTQFKRWRWRERDMKQALLPGDFVAAPAEQCRSEKLEIPWPDEFSSCLGLWSPEAPYATWIALAEELVTAIFRADGEALDKITIPGERFAQYYDGQPLLRSVVTLGEVPLYCAQAVIAIEDADFLEHRGISPTAIARAVLRNLRQARFAEGASTITQQLVKNYFLSSEKTLRRKITEQIMALLLELRVDKDQILANYLNVIYMGQQGSFQVRGFAAAAEHYFSQSLADLTLPQCALLAAIINNPRRYNPVRNPERALARRRLVLERMVEQNMISQDEFVQADASPLGARGPGRLSEPAPYFVQAVLEELRSLGLSGDHGLKVFTTLDPDLQEHAQKVIAQELGALERRLPKLVGASAGGPLQGAAIVADVVTGGVRAMVGGRQYRINQFDRIRMSRRQPGSLFKPLVYLAALETGDFNAETILIDEPWTHRYDGQVWTPKNYDKQFRGKVSMTEALAASLNVPTARLAVDVGIGSIVDLAARLGIESELAAVPALALGAAEVTPWELANSYLTLARLGERYPLHLFTAVTTTDGEELFRFSPKPIQAVRSEAVEQLTKMLQQTFVFGTAKGVRPLPTDNPPAGKTGTTSDTRDAWFAGYDPARLTLTWVGFDDNTSTGLTGATAALPMWWRIHYQR